MKAFATIAVSKLKSLHRTVHDWQLLENQCVYCHEPLPVRKKKKKRKSGRANRLFYVNCTSLAEKEETNVKLVTNINTFPSFASPKILPFHNPETIFVYPKFLPFPNPEIFFRLILKASILREARFCWVLVCGLFEVDKQMGFDVIDCQARFEDELCQECKKKRKSEKLCEDGCVKVTKAKQFGHDLAFDNQMIPGTMNGCAWARHILDYEKSLRKIKEWRKKKKIGFFLPSQGQGTNREKKTP